MKTLYDLIKAYLDYLTSLKYSPETLRKIRLELTAFNRFLQRSDVITAAILLPLHLNRWQQHLAARRTAKGFPLKARSINFKIAKIKGFLRHLAKNGYIQVHLAEAIVYVKEPNLLPGSILSHGQTKRLLAHMATDAPLGYRDRTILELLYTTGIRAGELLKLDIHDIDYTHHTALVCGKGNKQRVVPVGKTAMGYLSTYVKAVRPYILKDPAEKALFISLNGTRLEYSTFRRMVKKAADNLNLDISVTAHTFRRSCTTELIRSGANIYHVKELLGHASLNTLKPYTRLTITDLKKTHRKCHPRERESD